MDPERWNRVGQEMFSCEACPYQTLHKSALKRHHAQKHNKDGLVSYQCSGKDTTALWFFFQIVLSNKTFEAFCVLTETAPHFAFLTPGSGMGKKLRSGSVINTVPDYISRELGNNFFYADPGSGIYLTLDPQLAFLRRETNLT
jgi:hypothetical protein